MTRRYHQREIRYRLAVQGLRANLVHAALEGEEAQPGSVEARHRKIGYAVAVEIGNGGKPCLLYTSDAADE